MNRVRKWEEGYRNAGRVEGRGGGGEGGGERFESAGGGRRGLGREMIT